MSKKEKGITLTGGSSLLVIFAVLCLTVFALLTLSTVKADLRLADAAVQSVEDYYRADCEAEEVLARFREGIVSEHVTIAGHTADGICYTYGCPVSDTQELRVVVEITEEDYQILQWKVVSTTEWSPEEYIEVWSPEE